MKINSFSKDEVVLVRCMITGEYDDHYKGKDYQGNRYIIMKNKTFNNLSVGEDRAFYAFKRNDGGMFSGRIALYPLSHEQYLELLGNDRSGGKTLKELGVNLRNL